MLKQENNEVKRKNKKKSCITAIILVLMSSILIVKIIYDNNSKKFNPFKEISVDQVEKIDICFVTEGMYYDNINDADQVSSLMNYLNELEFKSTDEYAPNNTPDNGITVVLKNGDKLGMSIYGAEIAFLYPIEKYPDNCKLYGYNPKEFVNLCKNLNLSEMKSNDK